VTAASRWNAHPSGKFALSAAGKKRKCIRGKKENMNRKDELKRRIELKKQLIILTQKEINELNKLAATLATEKGEVTTPAA